MFANRLQLSHQSADILLEKGSAGGKPFFHFSSRQGLPKSTVYGNEVLARTRYVGGETDSTASQDRMLRCYLL
jgi:hypothetical protein